MDRGRGRDTLRSRATQTVAANARLLQQAPAAASRDEPGELVGTGGPAAIEGIFKRLDRTMPEAASRAEKLARRVGEQHIKAPGNVLDIVNYATSDNKPREAAKIIGSRLGAAAGGFVPGFEPVTIPAGAVLGDLAGGWVYDHRGDIRRASEDVLRTITQTPRHPGAYKY